MAQELVTLQDLQEFRLQLIEDFKEIVQPNVASQIEWLRSADVRKLLGISPSTLQNLRVHGDLPYSKIGKLFYYKQSDIVKVLETNSRGNTR